MPILNFLLGLTLLTFGAELLVRGASRLSASLGISPLVVGLTIVAFGTSTPELAVSIKSALSGQPDMALGNVVGSNIFNVLFILGLCALIVPLVVSQQLIRFDVPLMIALSFILLFLSMDHNLSRSDGLLLTAGLVAYVWFLIKKSRREFDRIQPQYAAAFGETAAPKTRWLKETAFVLAGLALLIFGSRWFVDGAVSIARILEVDELVIGLTIVAAGTSTPEIVTSVVAAIRGQRDIAVGNVVGSNIFNITGVLGLSSVVTPAGIQVAPAFIGFDIPIMIAVSLACLPIFFTGNVISRTEAVVFLGYYAVYTLYLVMHATHHAQLALLNATMLYFVIPLTALTLFTIVVREARQRMTNDDK